MDITFQRYRKIDCLNGRFAIFSTELGLVWTRHCCMYRLPPIKCIRPSSLLFVKRNNNRNVVTILYPRIKVANFNRTYFAQQVF